MSYQGPVVQPRFGELIGQGMSEGAQSIAEGIAALKQRTRQTTAMRAMAVDGLGMDADEVDKMTLPQLTGKLQGAALKSANQAKQAQMMDLNSQAKERESIGAFRQSAADKAAQETTAMKLFNEKIGSVADATKLTPGQIQQFMGQSGLSADQQKSVGDSMRLMMENGEGGAMSFNEDPITGARFAVKGKQVMPSGQNPSKVQAPNAVSLLDPTTGQPTGTLIAPHPNGKGFTVIKGPNAAANGRLDEQTVNAYQQSLFGDGASKVGLLDQIRSADEQNAKAKAGVLNPATKQPYKAFPADQYQDLVGGANRIRTALKTHDAASGGGAAAPVAAPGAGAAAGPAPADLINQAKQAIAGGADPAAVAGRLKSQYGIDMPAQ